MSRKGSSPARALMVTALPALLSRTVISRLIHSGTGATDQSETPCVTTAPTGGTPSETSTPALIQESFRNVKIDPRLVELLGVIQKE